MIQLVTLFKRGGFGGNGLVSFEDRISTPSWPSMSCGWRRISAPAILATDYNAIMGITIVVASTYLLVNFVVDLLYVRLDPRVKLT